MKKLVIYHPQEITSIQDMLIKSASLYQNKTALEDTRRHSLGLFNI